MKKSYIAKFYTKKILLLIFISSIFSIAFYYGIDKKVLVFAAFILSVFTEVFVGVGLLIGTIPVVGPMIIKLVTIPIFWVFNAMGTLISGIAIKKGYATEMARGRILTLALLIGITIGYIIGNLVPIE
tara:strand:+ start:207 stop:590 length:384 start_codon:yes stop_codon:yes gene_type:complete